MKCKWYADFEGVCTNGECPYRGDTCPTSEHPEACKHAEEKPEIPQLSVEELVKSLRLCDSASPTSECPANSPRKEIVKKALALAMHRVEPKNRVLTLEEARNAEVDTFGTAMHWLELKIHTCKVQCEEIRCAVLAVSIFFEDKSEDGEPDAVYSYADRHDEWLTQEEYGKRWRCWLRKPTPKEMEETPWAGDSHE